MATDAQLDAMVGRIDGVGPGPAPAELSDLVRTHLEGAPGDRLAVAEAAESRGVGIDWKAVNRGRTDGLAIVYAFTPWNATSGLVAARRTRQRGEVVDVICNTLGGKRATDPSSALIAGPWVGEQHVVEHPPHFTAWSAVSAFTRAVFETLEESGRAGSYRSVYSRATWAASHVAAALYKIRYPDVRWVAEMSDPLSRTITGKLRVATMRRGPIVKELRQGLASAGVDAPQGLGLFQWTEHLPYALADEIIFTNPHQLEFMMSYCDDPRLVERVRSIATIAPHPTLPRHLYDVEPTEYPLDPERIHLAYFGVFYVTRGLTELTEALGLLGPSERSRVQLHVFTNKPEPILEEVDAAGLADVISVNAYRPYLGFLNLTTKFDVLVVNDSDTRSTHVTTNPYLPSKVSDYLGSGTSIWGIYEPGSVLSTLDLAHRSEITDVSGAVAVLRTLVADRQRASEHSG